MIKNIKEKIAQEIAAIADVSIDESLATIEITKKEFGDISSKIAFIIASKRKDNSVKIAAETAEILNKKKIKFIERVEAIGPYINFYFSGEFYASVVKEIVKQKEKFGKGKKTSKKMIVEFFHANTHKGVHIGHIRNASIGESLSRILEYSGNRVIRANYQGDIGPHVAKCLWGFINLYNEKAPRKNRGIWLGKVYSDASQRIEGKRDLEQQVQEINQKIYSNDKKLVKIWKKTRQWCLNDFEKFYKEFGIKFDKLYFESQTESIGKEISIELLKKGIAKLDQDAVIIDLRDDDLGVFVLITKERYPLYSAKDLGLAKLKFKKYKNINKSIHVVGKEQEFYFKQLFKTFEKIGKCGDKLFENATKISHHLIYELVMLPEGKMSSREGTMVLYEELKERLIDVVKQEVKKRHEKWSEKQIKEIALKIVIAAIKFSMLRRESNRTITFDWKEALNLEGDSGPYLQYAYVRINSILRKADYKPEIINGCRFNEDERTLIKKLCEFPEIVRECENDLTPHSLVEYLLHVATLLNKFYTTSPVLSAEREVERKTRLAIVQATQNVLKNAFYLIGIDCLERM